MPRVARRRSLVLMLGLALVVAAVPLLVHADHSWGGYHWARTANPFTLKLGDNVTSAWDSYLATTSSDWSASSVLNTTVVASGKNPRNCRPTSGRVEVCNTTYGNNGWLGIAQIWLTSGHISQGTVKLNDTYFNTSAYNTPAWRNLVMCQEVGHTFGLDHQDEDFGNPPLGTCMDYSNDPNPNQHPNAHDYDLLEDIYAHLDSFTTVKRGAVDMPPAMTDVDYATPAQWGKLVEASEDGLSAVYLLDFGHGNYILTHVLWANPELFDDGSRPDRVGRPRE